jgi:hypothetical protein
MNAVLSTLFAQALSSAPEIVIALVLAILSPFLVGWLRAKASKAQLEMIVAGADIVYPVVDALARATPGGLDDKAVAGFDVFRKQLRLTLSKKDEPKLRAVFTAKHEAARMTAADLAAKAAQTDRRVGLKLDPDLAPRVSGVSSIPR